MNIKVISIPKLKTAKYNPRIITVEEFEGLKQSIRTFGLVDPLIINKDRTVIGGHQRLRACIDLGFEKVTCNILDLNKKQEKKLNIILNSQSISGGYDQLMLDELLEEFKLDDDYESLRMNELESNSIEDSGLPEDETVSDSLYCRFKFGDIQFETTIIEYKKWFDNLILSKAVLNESDITKWVKKQLKLD